MMGLYLTQTQLALCIVVLSLITAAIKIAEYVVSQLSLSEAGYALLSGVVSSRRT